MSWHALIAHLPLGCLVASLVFDLLYAVTRRDEFATVGWWTLLLGTFFGAGALATGLWARGGLAGLSSVARTAVDVHATLGYVAVALFLGLCLLRLLLGRRVGERWAGAYLAAASIATALFVATTYFGLRTVRAFAVGLPGAALEQALEARPRRGPPARTVPGAPGPGPKVGEEQGPPAAADTSRDPDSP